LQLLITDDMLKHWLVGYRHLKGHCCLLLQILTGSEGKLGGITQHSNSNSSTDLTATLAILSVDYSPPL